MSQNHNITSMAENLIQEHFELDPSLEKVIWVNSDKPAEIRLLEITPETFPAGEVLSYYFPPDDEFPYATIMAQITPEEWQKVLRNEIILPEGWTLENHKVYSREMVAA
jgi:hypothetical protein